MEARYSDSLGIEPRSQRFGMNRLIMPVIATNINFPERDMPMWIGGLHSLKNWNRAAAIAHDQDALDLRRSDS